MSDYRSLIVWQRAHRLTLRVYGISKAFPPDERYGLTSQLRRAMASVPANIAEGLGRDSNRETVRYCRIAQGSLNEVEYHFLLARDLGYIDAPNSEMQWMSSVKFDVCSRNSSSRSPRIMKSHNWRLVTGNW